MKPEKDWSNEDDKLAIGNSKALNALFNGVDKNFFGLINTCIISKDAWEILKISYGGRSDLSVLSLFEKVADSKSRHRLFFYPIKERVKRARKTF